MGSKQEKKKSVGGLSRKGEASREGGMRTYMIFKGDGLLRMPEDGKLISGRLSGLGYKMDKT